MTMMKCQGTWTTCNSMVIPLINSLDPALPICLVFYETFLIVTALHSMRESIPPPFISNNILFLLASSTDDSRPHIMFIGVHNSMALEADTACKVALYSPYWVDNRTGVDLVFKDVDVPKMFADIPFLGKSREPHRRNSTEQQYG